MFFTTRLLAKAKSKYILVQLESVATGHKFYMGRERLGDKLEFFKWDPWLQMESLYKEKKKIRSFKK